LATPCNPRAIEVVIELEGSEFDNQPHNNRDDHGQYAAEWGFFKSTIQNFPRPPPLDLAGPRGSF
jgi:hypothetical protein